MSSLSLPMTEATREIVRRERERIRGMHALVCAGVLVGAPLIAVAGLTGSSPNVRAIAGSVIVGALAVAAVIVLLLTLAHASDERRMGRDLRSPHYLRSTGRLSVGYVENDEGGGWYYIDLDNERLRSPWGRRPPPIGGLDHATVDHTPQAHLVFAITDAAGWDVYVADGYKVRRTVH